MYMGDSQLGGGPHREVVDHEMEMGDAHVDGGPRECAVT